MTLLTNKQTKIIYRILSLYKRPFINLIKEAGVEREVNMPEDLFYDEAYTIIKTHSGYLFNHKKIGNNK